MVGNVDEGSKDIKKTFKLLKELNPDYVQISILSLYPATPVYQKALDEKLLEKDVWLEFAKEPLKEFSSPIWSANFNRDELFRITARGYRQFYLRPRFILGQIRKLTSFKQFILLAKAAFRILFQSSYK